MRSFSLLVILAIATSVAVSGIEAPKMCQPLVQKCTRRKRSVYRFLKPGKQKKDKILSTISRAEEVFSKSQVKKVLSEFHKSISHTAWPFLAYIEVYKKDMEDKLDASLIQSVCTGALVNSQYVLSASHCFCLVSPPLTCLPGTKSSVEYDPMKRISIWIGVNSISLEQRYSSFEDDFYFKVESIKLHPEYERTENGDIHDIALVKLNRPVCDPSVKVNKDRIPQPIKLAEDWIFKDVLQASENADMQVLYEEKYGKGPTKFSKFKVNPIFRAGYGIAHEHGACRTQMGPSPLERCKFPFKVKYASGFEHTKHNNCEVKEKVFHSCVDTTKHFPPGFLQKECIQFEKIWKKKNPKKSFIRHGHISIGKKIITESFQPNYQILNSKSNCTTQCYPIDMLLNNLTKFNDAPTNYGILNYGWCATCDPDARPGEHNYCGHESTGDEKAEMAIAWPHKNWGFCSKECSKDDEVFVYEPSYSGTGYMFFLNDSTCQSLIEKSGMDVDLSHEFCATDILLNQERRFKVNFKTEEFEEISQIHNTEHQTILGTFDRRQIICNGDSGGPVWVIMTEAQAKEKNKVRVVPYLVGVTRRSSGCGLRDRPAIFGKISYYRKWILSSIQDAKPKETCPDDDIKRIQAYRTLRMNNVYEFDYYSDDDNSTSTGSRKPFQIDMFIKVPPRG